MLTAADALLADARAGSGRLLVLDGPAGIGKTRLLAAIHERAEAAGMPALRARAGELEQDFPFGVVHQLFDAPLAGPARADLLSGAAELAGTLFDVAGSRELPVADPAYNTLHGLYWLTVNVVDAGPVLLSVDDLHWCDPASLRYLAYLARRLDGLGMLVVATMRPRTGSEPGVIDEITDAAGTTVLRLSPLSIAGVAAVLASHFGADLDPAFSSTVSEWTAGNPLLVRELIAETAARRIEGDGRRCRPGARPGTGQRRATRAAADRAVGPADAGGRRGGRRPRRGHGDRARREAGGSQPRRCRPQHERAARDRRALT